MLLVYIIFSKDFLFIIMRNAPHSFLQVAMQMSGGVGKGQTATRPLGAVME